MIDKIEVRVPYSASFQPNFRFVSDELRFARFGSRVQPSRHYHGVVNLREDIGIDDILHVHCKHGPLRNHKLELLETGRKSLAEMAAIIGRIFDVNLDSLGLMRVDCAADLEGIPVLHLHSSIRVRFKRTSDAEGEREYQDVGSRRLEYFRYGRAPNCLRVYDKVAECRARFPRIARKASRDAEPLRFEEVFGFSSDAMITRLERQCGGGRIPNEIDTFGKLRNAASFNPFPNVEVCSSEFLFPDTSGVNPGRAVKLAGIRSYIEQYGRQVAYGMLNTDRNAKRLFDDYDAYLNECAPTGAFTVASIVESYRRSTQAQIDGSTERVRLKIA